MSWYRTLLVTLMVDMVSPFCWKPNLNPFTGAPDTVRLDGTTVSVNWDLVFPSGPACDDVEFLIKSHPIKNPSNYKLSDLTLKGKRTATLAVPHGEDFTFTVIARENKGTGIGIEYAYSRPAASIYTLKTSTRNQNSRQYRRQYSPPSTTTSPPPPPPTTPRTYLRPSVRSLEIPRFMTNQLDMYDDSSNFDYNLMDDNGGNGGGAAPWYVYECVPLLKNLAGFETGSKKNSILTQFIKHMNQNAVGSVSSFVGDKKSCKSGYQGEEAGHLVTSDQGVTQCCSTPWGTNSYSKQAVCYDQFARCDGKCIPHDWVADGWPDCMDGADEANLTVDGKVFPFQLGCVHCAGVILSSAFLCIESSAGLTRDCLEEVLGPGECNVCINEYMSLP